MRIVIVTTMVVVGLLSGCNTDVTNTPSPSPIASVQYDAEQALCNAESKLKEK